MLVLFESPAGYAIFKLVNEKKLQETENLFLDFETPEKASKIIKLKHFEKFNDYADAAAAVSALIEGKMSKQLKKMLKKVVVKEAQEQLAVADTKLGGIIKDKLHINCVSNTNVQELMRCIRSQMDSLISGIPSSEMAKMTLGLAHSLARYKLKFSPDKVDTMIIQAISLLDDLDKELNNYIMRCKEWYGWHFPELSKIITDNTVYVLAVKAIGLRTNAAECDLSDILSSDLEQKVKEMAEISMGTEISDDDMKNIIHLCNEIQEMQTYRSQLYEYLKNRMMAIAPNLTVLVGEIVGARLIAHAGSLINLAKHPASTVQILGAEKALFRALKTKHDTPKYGLIYHAQLVGQTNTKLKGKMSRMLAAKSSLACRVDALGEDISFELGAEHKAKLEARLRVLEEGGVRQISGSGKARAKWEKYENKSQVFQYDVSQDSTLPSQSKKRKLDDSGTGASPIVKKIKIEDDESEETKPTKRKKQLIEEIKSEGVSEEEEAKLSSPKKKKQKSAIEIKTVEETVASPSKKKKKHKNLPVQTEETEEVPEETTQVEIPDEDQEIKSEKKKKKKKKSKHEDL
ncbi:nucleolar protein 58 isoform X2 [Centruroides vittatus]|uniref:nucleolar protein 58 isoform X2 n=1 Tax=Centruroides vittatus TaxID=120091 RepID=UPI00350F4A7F